MLSASNFIFQLQDGKVLQRSQESQRIIKEYSCSGKPIAAVQCGGDGENVAILESSRMLRIYSTSGEVTTLHLPTPAVAIFVFNTGLLIECHADNLFPGVRSSSNILYTLSAPFFALRPVHMSQTSFSAVKCVCGDHVITWGGENGGQLQLYRLSRVPVLDSGLPNTSLSLTSPESNRKPPKPSFRPASKSNRCSTPTNISTALGVSPTSNTSPAALSFVTGAAPAPDTSLTLLSHIPHPVTSQCQVGVWEAHHLLLVCDEGVLWWCDLHNLHMIGGSITDVNTVEHTHIESNTATLTCLSIMLSSGAHRLMLSPTTITTPLLIPRLKRNHRMSQLSSALIQALLLLDDTNEVISLLIPVLITVYEDVHPIAAIPCLLLLLHGHTDLNDIHSVIAGTVTCPVTSMGASCWQQKATRLMNYSATSSIQGISTKTVFLEMIIAGLVDALFHGSDLSQEYRVVHSLLTTLNISIEKPLSSVINNITSIICSCGSTAVCNPFPLLYPMIHSILPSARLYELQHILMPSLNMTHKLFQSMVSNSTEISTASIFAAFIAVLKDSGRSVAELLSLLPASMRVVISMSLSQTLYDNEDGSIIQMWSKDVLQYVGRDDIVFNLHPPSVPPTTPSAGDVDGLKTCATIGEELFPLDERMLEVCRMLRATAPLYLRVDRPPEMSDAAHRLKLQQRLLALTRRSLAGAVGRGMVTFASHHALVAESLPIPTLSLSGRVPPSNAMVNLDASAATQDFLAWPEFHNGVAAGMRVRGSVTRNWILYNKTLATTAAAASETSPALTGHAGSLLALGLRGHLNVLTASDICDYLTMNYDSATISILLGCAASKLGSCDSLLSKSLCLHLPALVYNQTTELSIPHLIQCTSIVGLGLLHCGSGGRLLVEFLLKEITRRGDECHDGIIFASGMALGLLLLGYGQEEGGKPRGCEQLSDLSIEDRLQRCITGGDRSSSDVNDSYKPPTVRSLESNMLNVNATAPAAIIALALMYMKTGNDAVAARLALPQTAYEIDSIRPDMLLYKAMAHCLVKWHGIRATEEWLVSFMPKLIKDSLFGGPVLLSGKPASISRRTALHSFLCIIAGACWGLALSHAGTANSEVKALLMKQLRLLQSLRDGTSPPLPTYSMWQCRDVSTPAFLKAITDKASRSVVELCMIQVSVSLGMVCAGSGDVDALRQFRVLRWRVEDVSFGTHMGLTMAIGFLFLGSGRMSLKRDNVSIAALVISTCPRYPSRSQDNSTHLQPLRHLYALAVEERCLQSKDVVSREAQRIPVEIKLRSGEVEMRETPCLLPELSTIESVVSRSASHHATFFPISDLCPKPLVLYVRNKAVNIPSALEQQLSSDLLSLRSRLLDEDDYDRLQKKWEHQIIIEWATSPIFSGVHRDSLLEIGLFACD